MTPQPLRRFIQHIYQTVASPWSEDQLDRQLLQRYLSQRDEEAFARLVERHGPLVLGVCRRLAIDGHDADDVFQATFLVLARKASSLKRQGTLAGWLYTVAYRLALRVKTDEARRREQQRQAREMLPMNELDSPWCELRPLLDAELNQLPEKFRTPTVLCYLQGLSNEEAAQQLGCPVGTIKSRLAHARELLRTRLVRRGVVLSSAALLTGLATEAHAAVSEHLLHTTVEAVRQFAAGAAPGTLSAGAQHLAQGALHTMMMTQLKIACVFIVSLGMIGLGTVYLAWSRQSLPAETTAEESPTAPGEEFDYDPEPYLGISFMPDNQRFGFVLLKEKDPIVPDKFKKLTYAEDGSTSNTCVKLDGYEHLFGQSPGHWARSEDKSKRLLNGVETIKGRQWVSAWEWPGRVRVTQTVRLVPNAQTRKLDTALVHYTVENRDKSPHKVGLRIMLDTYVGAEDGVPIAIPGEAGLLTTKKDFDDPNKIPEFIQALERPNISDPGTVATMVLKLPPGFAIQRGDPALDPIIRMVISRWPGNPEIRWDFTKDKFWDMNDKTRGERNDSCTTLYWEERLMPPQSKRVMGFTYGLGKVHADSEDKGTQLALTTAGQPMPGGTFTVLAWVKGTERGQKVALKLPAGMSLDESDSEDRVVRRLDETTGLWQAAWKVNVDKDVADGDYAISATTGNVTAKLPVRVRKNKP